MEQWNNGLWEAGTVVFGKTILTRKLINEGFPYKTIIPIFQHSIIPCARQKLKPQKIPLISISCRISETFNYIIPLGFIFLLTVL